MKEEKSNRDMIVETNRDVKWICRTLEEMKESIGDHENRIRDLEGLPCKSRCDLQETRLEHPFNTCFKSESAGRERQISAGVGAGAGGLVAVLMKFWQ
ncbi:hypothetical protein Mpet_1104 [Methanolacinia petrolearia DSM 11571]|uniref:Uncharacterized protein n=1 Tax=Methanolacinia petrolearia (strain DSM 11571 / OCM 486 / SEBR 4847) TaxID=679926 RepID=E1RCX0_METP4|nr:hypothetical protein Mpet_1104 [Methanolacinia petrolearia DSM 11571]